MYDNFDKKTMESLKAAVEENMAKYQEHVTLDDIREWFANGETYRESWGHSTYGVKHTIEHHYGQLRGQKLCYCANNWVKYVIVEQEIPVKNKIWVKHMRKYVTLHTPTPENVLDNTVNYVIDLR